MTFSCRIIICEIRTNWPSSPRSNPLIRETAWAVGLTFPSSVLQQLLTKVGGMANIIMSASRAVVTISSTATCQM